MMPILQSQIDGYLSGLLPEREPVLQEMEAYAAAHEFPIVGPLVGRLLWQLVKMNAARQIFEMGSGFGYSTYWLAKGLPDDGKIIFTEFLDENIKLARDFLRKGGIDHKVEVVQGDAVEVLEAADGQFDLILNDIDKEHYPKSLEVILPHLRRGGVLVTDNLLWHGRVTDVDPDVQTQGILEYTKRIYNSPDLWTTIIPLRDGVGVSLKL